MKKLFSLISVTLLLSLVLSGCGGEPAPEGGEELGGSAFITPDIPISAESEFLSLEIKESAYIMRKGYLYCVAVVHNPNADLSVKFPAFRITARDSDGLILGTSDQVLSDIYPTRDFYYAGLAFKVDEVPGSVEFEVLSPSDYNILKTHELERPDHISLTAFNSVIRGEHVLGEISNENDYDISSAIVTVVFRDADGNLVSGDSTFISDIPGSGSSPFDLKVDKSFIADSFEVYSYMW